MAATIAPNAAFDAAKIIIRSMPLQSIQYRILDDANKFIWMADSWRWTMGSLNNFDLVSNQQDYPYGASLPADYLYTKWAYATDGDQMDTMHVESSLPTTSVIAAGCPTQICRLVGENTFRVFPKPGTLGTTYTVVQQYKKTAPTINAGNAATGGVLVMDDEWFHVYAETVNYYALRYAYDDRAGTVQLNQRTGDVAYTGQLGVVMALIDDMRKREPLPKNWNLRPEREATRK